MDLIKSFKELKENTKIMTVDNNHTGERLIFIINKDEGEVVDVISNVYPER